MKVTIIGAGNMGKGLTRQIAKAGHQVTVTARDLDKAEALAKEFANVTAVPAEQSSSFSTRPTASRGARRYAY